MKKSYLILIASVILSVGAYSQKGLDLEIIAQPGISMGGNYQHQSAPGINGIYDWTNMNKAYTLGVNAGASIGYNFNDKISVSAGLQFSQQGQNYKDYTYTYKDMSIYHKRDVILNYLKIPIQFYFAPTSKKNVSFICSAGLYFGYLLNYKDKNTFTVSYSVGDFGPYVNTASGMTYNEGSTDSVYVLLSKPYKIYDLGGIVATGLQIKLSDNLFLPVMLNYQFGFIDVKNESSKYKHDNSNNIFFWKTPNNTLSYRNSSLGLKIGLKFNL
jgi:hypothetical protein